MKKEAVNQQSIYVHIDHVINKWRQAAFLFVIF